MTDSQKLLVLSTLVWLACAAVVLFIYFQGLDGIKEGEGDRLGRDFINFWSGGKAMAAGTVSQLYDTEVYRQFLINEFDEPLRDYNYSYPPHSALLLSPFGVFPYVWALILWTGLGLFSYFLSIKSYLKSSTAWVWMVSPAVLICMITGQASFFLAALLIGGLILSPKRPWIAGILFGLLTIKPQYGPLLALALVLSGHWKTILSTIVTAALLTGASVIAFGIDPWVIFITETLPLQSRIIAMDFGLFDFMVPSIFKWAINLGLSTTAAWGLQSISMIVSVVLTIRVFRSTRPWLEKVAILCVLIFLFSPYIVNYDMVLLTPALILLFDRLPKVTIFLFFLPFFGLAGAIYHIPLYQVSLLFLAVVLAFNAFETEPAEPLESRLTGA